MVNTIFTASIYEQICLCWTSLCTEEPSTHSYHEPNKKNAILPFYLLSKLCIPFFFIICMLHATYVLSWLLQLWWYLVKSNSHDAHYRIFCSPLFLPPSHTKYSPHHPALHTLNVCSSLDVRHQISHPNKIKGTMSLLKMSTCNILNWMAASIAWIHPALFFQDHGPQFLSGS